MVKKLVKTVPFLGRERELTVLRDLLDKKTASLVVIKGRRRVGKSRLSEEFAKDMRHYVLTGMAPEAGVRAQMQRDDFAGQLRNKLNIPAINADDWRDLFWHLANQTQQGRVLIVLDEINWMGDLDPTFLPKLKTAWDTLFKKNPELIMILTGSMSKWVDENILSSTGFMGRLSSELTLNELPLPVCNEFWYEHKDNVSPYEKYKVLSVTGGIPRYLEEVHPGWPAEKNIMRLCFRKEGVLFNEFDRIFSDLFVRKSNTYKKIVKACVVGSRTLEEIGHALEMKKGGTISDYVDDLVKTGYLARDFTWHLQTGAVSKLCRYRLKDNYLRFYLKYIEPHRHRIEKGEIKKLPAWDSVMGLQFENLVLNNSKKIIRLLGLDVNDVVNNGPYFQRKTAKREGCQVDHLIQTKYHSLHLVEIKFSKNKIGMEVVSQVKKKMAAINSEKQYSIWPVLIHVNGVSDAVVESGFFSKIINFADFLHTNKENNHA